MQTLPIHEYFPHASRLIYGCMALGGNWQADALSKAHVEEAKQMLDVCLDNGINMFDHADIYGHGLAEAAFGEALKSQSHLREKIIIQSKCGIRFADGKQQAVTRYDFSKEWIIQSVENSLTRLNTDYLDILFLHRPDPLMQPDEVASAFEQLKRSGKVRNFAVSNMNAHQIQLIQSEASVPVIANQIEMSLAQLNWLNEGISANQNTMASVGFNAGTIEHSRLNNIQMQSWGSLAQGLFSGREKLDESNERIRQTSALVRSLAADYQTSAEAILLAFLWRHPMKMQTVVGSSNTSRIAACSLVEAVSLSAEHWYQLYVSARGEALP